MSEVIAKCTSCEKTWTMSPQQIREARDNGCAISPCCMAPATIQRVKTPLAPRTKAKR